MKTPKVIFFVFLIVFIFSLFVLVYSLIKHETSILLLISISLLSSIWPIIKVYFFNKVKNKGNQFDSFNSNLPN